MPDSPEPNPNILSARRLASYLQVSYVTIIRLLERGEMPGQKVGGQWRTHRHEVDAWVGGWPLPQPKRGGSEP
jgi:excisionase family DNA binding protein